MAGIGFILRKLASQDNFSGIIRAYVHSAIVAVGPWIMIVLSIGSITVLTENYVGLREVDEFLAIILYNFLFSFCVSAPLYMVTARYVSDCLYAKDFRPIPGIVVSSLVLLLIGTTPVSTAFYFFYANMKPIAILLSVINFSLLAQIWIVMLYLGCIRDFRAITFSWVVGTLLAIYLAIEWGRAYGSNGMLMGLNVGLVVLVYSLIAQIFAEYRYGYVYPKDYHYFLIKYNNLLWGGFFLFAGMWVDKVIMWFSPQALTHLNNLRTYPTYDGGMFMSYLSIIPVMALFIFRLETNFYVSYIQYIKRIEYNDPLVLIEEEKDNIWEQTVDNGRSFLVLQGSISFIIIMLAPTIFQWVGADFMELGIFRLGALGAFFGALNFFIIIFFTYFDSQTDFILITGFMFLSNLVLTLITLLLGFSFYGYGYCLSMILTFLFGALLLARFLDKLTYHIFITNIVKRQHVTEPIDIKEKE